MTSSQQNESSLMEVTHVFTREEAKASLGHIFELFNNDKHDLVTEEMANGIQLKHTKVLSKADKSFLRMWAYSAGDSRVLGLLEISPDDLDSYSWTEMVEKPSLDLLSAKSNHTPWIDAKNCLAEKDEYQLVEDKIEQLYTAIEDQKKRASDWQLNMQIRLAELSEEISALKRDLESVEQHNAEITQFLKRVPAREESEDPVFTDYGRTESRNPIISVNDVEIGTEDMLAT
ncbi:hypothetical protein THARTR1_07484 [Trichoderma harzianum]|uniref:Uncharacterized protein n=1 Tax=Trichoderma harzianum TaxID=5544 RepID=A0A2K0U3D0_TRIHA|nr:hypothetical protein THARTR1_07484 [Trichoderma harzianum]